MNMPYIIFIVFYKWICPVIVLYCLHLQKAIVFFSAKSGADLAFVIRGGPNSEHFLSNLWKLLKRGKSQSLIVKRNWVYIKQFIKACFLLKKRLLIWYFFGWFLFKNKARGGSKNFEKGGGGLIWLDMVYFMIILAKRGR